MTDTTRRSYPVGEGRSISLGTILFGLILITLGALWLLNVSGAIDVTWTFVAAVMLVLVGVALLIGAREGSHGGLIFLGIVLTAVVAIGSLASWPSIGAGVGERAYTPESINEVESSYSWGIGTQSVDLRNIDFPDGRTEISMQLGTGEINVWVPDDIAIRVEWQVGVGDVQVVDRDQSGVGLRGTYESPGFEDADRQLTLDIQLGMGALEVSQ